MQTARVFTRRSRPAGCLIVLSALHPSERSDTVRQMLIAMREQTVTALHARLGESVATGELSAHANLDAIARYYVTVQQGMSIQARDGASRRDLEAVAQAALAACCARTRERRIKRRTSERSPQAKPHAAVQRQAPCTTAPMRYCVTACCTSFDACHTR